MTRLRHYAHHTHSQPAYHGSQINHIFSFGKQANINAQSIQRTNQSYKYLNDLFFCFYSEEILSLLNYELSSVLLI